METVAPDPRIVETARQGKPLHDRSLAAMEGGIEARDLWQPRCMLGDRPYRGQVVRFCAAAQAE